MSYIGNKDWLAEVAKGNVASHSLVHKFGRNPGVPNGSWELISTLSTTVTHRTSAATMRPKAGGNAADTADAGAGARTVTIEGIDSSFDETQETLTLNGASAGATSSASFWRVHRVWVAAVGTYGAANTGNITIEDSGGSSDLLKILAGEGQSQYCGWTTPANVTAYLLSLRVHVDTNKTANVRVLTRETIDDTSAPMPGKRLRLFFDGIEGGFSYEPRSPSISIPEKSDIWVEAYGDGAASEVSAEFELLTVDSGGGD